MFLLYFSCLDIFRLKVKNKRNNPWGNIPRARSTSNKKARITESPDNLYYSMPNGKLPLLSQAVSMVLSEDFHFDQSPYSMTSKVKSERVVSLDDSPEQGMNVHRRQKIKRKRFRLVFHVRILTLLIFMFLYSSL